MTTFSFAMTINELNSPPSSQICMIDDSTTTSRKNKTDDVGGSGMPISPSCDDDY